MVMPAWCNVWMNQLYSGGVNSAPFTSADQIAGRDVYSQFCSACHNGGDETAPVLDELHGLGRDRAIARDLLA